MPSPFRLGVVNALLLVGDPPTLVDPGPSTPEARAAVEEGCAGAGVPVHALRRVVITHSHLDHCSLCAWVHERSGAHVDCHPTAAEDLVQMPLVWERRRALLRRAAAAGGFPAESWERMDALQAARSPLAVAVPTAAIRTWRDGARLRAGGAHWSILHTPGHARDHICLFHRPSGTLISGDMLLRHLPTPAWLEDRTVDGSRPSTLANLIASWRRLGKLPVSIAWPGHGTAVRAHRILIARRLATTRTLLIDARGAIRGGASTVCEIAEALGMDVSAEGLPATLGDIVAVADYLVSRGSAARSVVDGIVRFEPA